ncbi:hypothetical protein SAMN04515647_3796 [Cohaesibacter sp. ES.047]|nr:hypothetical protein SAMN04515647_3796 [Cohaesibacter sp. ES.047]
MMPLEGVFVGMIDGAVCCTTTDISAIAPHDLTLYQLVEGEEVPHIGWVLENDAFVKPEPPLTPLSSRQIRLILNRHNYLSQVEPAIKAIPDEITRNEAHIEWTYASSFDSSHPLIETMRVALGISEADMETMWREGMVL